MLSRLRRYRALAPEDRRVLVLAAGLLPLAALSLRIGGLRRAQAIMDRCLPLAPRGPGAGAAVAERLALLVAAAARHGPFKAKCLPVALAARGMLRRRGLAAELRIGVRKVGSRLDAHAWLEHEGTPLAQGGDVRASFAAFGDAQSRVHMRR